MKKIIFILACIGGGFGWLHVLQKQNPKVITDPVYGEVRIQGNSPGGTFEMAMFAQAADQEDCRRGVRMLEGILTPQVQDTCPTCAVTKSECKPELAPRYAKLFADEPTSVTYVSFARGDATERELRMVFWGVTAAESTRLCEALLPNFQKTHKGAVKCIYPE